MSVRVGIACRWACTALAVAGSAGCQRQGAEFDASAYQARPTGTLTFTRDIAPILHERCGGCHRPAGPAPFALLDYQQVAQRAVEIRSATESGEMPPWLPQEGCGKFTSENRLTAQQIGLLAQWIDEGAAEGDESDLPVRPASQNFWQRGTPDLIVSTPQPFTLPGMTLPEIRSFVIPTSVSRSRFVEAVELHTSAPAAIVHASLWRFPSGALRHLEQRDPEPGFRGTVPEQAALPGERVLLWTPYGAAPESLSNGTWQLRPEQDFVLQLEFRPRQQPLAMQARLGIYFSDQPPLRSPAVIWLEASTSSGQEAIPGDAAAGNRFTLPRRAQLLAVYPHAPPACASLHAVATLPDGTNTCVIQIDSWDARWPHFCVCQDPAVLPAGTTIDLDCTFHQTALSVAAGRDPSRQLPASWHRGESGSLALFLLAEDDGERDIILAESRRAGIDAQLTTYQQRLEKHPENADLHFEFATLSGQIGKPGQAVTHLRQAINLQPDHADAHFRLAQLYGFMKKHAEQIRHYRQAIAVRPDHDQAHFELAAQLLRQGELDAAANHLQSAIDSRPDFVSAHINLAVVSKLLGEPEQQIEHFRRALEIQPDSIDAHVGLATALAARRQTEQAVSQFDQALQTDPDNESALIGKARTLQEIGRIDEALQIYRTANRSHPESLAAITGMAGILAIHPQSEQRDPDQAIYWAEYAAEISARQDPRVLDVLAAAYASAGRYAEALEALESVIEIAESRGFSRILEQLRSRRGLYQKQQAEQGSSNVP